MIGSISLRIPLLAAGLAALAAPPVAPGASAPDRTVTFGARFAGVAADHRYDVWEGTAEGAARGRVTVALRQVEEPAAAARPVWHVAAEVTVRDETGVHSFTAGVEGMVDWKAGTLRLGGVVTDGWLAGSWAEVDGRLVNGDVQGTLSIAPPVALAPR